MPTELQKLAKAMAEIKRRFPSGGRRYSTIVEDPFASGFWPLPKPTKAAAAAGRVRRERRTLKPAPAR